MLGGPSGHSEWFIRENNTGGKIIDGAFTAPLDPGTYHVGVTAAGQTLVATVTVTACTQTRTTKPDNFSSFQRKYYFDGEERLRKVEMNGEEVYFFYGAKDIVELAYGGSGKDRSVSMRTTHSDAPTAVTSYSEFRNVGRVDFLAQSVFDGSNFALWGSGVSVSDTTLFNTNGAIGSITGFRFEAGNLWESYSTNFSYDKVRSQPLRARSAGQQT